MSPLRAIQVASVAALLIAPLVADGAFAQSPSPSNAGSGWMVEGSPARLLRDYNQLIDSYNRGANI